MEMSYQHKSSLLFSEMNVFLFMVLIQILHKYPLIRRGHTLKESPKVNGGQPANVCVCKQ